MVIVNLDNSTYGRIGELLAEIELLERGHEVARPSVDTGYDLVVDGRLRVQVKHARKSTVTTLNGKPYYFNVFGNPRRRWNADVYVFCANRGETWWIVPGAVLRDLGVKEKCNLRSGATGLSAHLEPYIDAWHILKEPDAFFLKSDPPQSSDAEARTLEAAS